MIIVTGATGFIGSCLVGYLNQKGHKDIIVVDELLRVDKLKNLADKNISLRIDRELFIKKWFSENKEPIEMVFHLGARTDTTEKDTEIFDTLNLNYSKKIWEICTQQQIPLIYASSAATYGLGEYGYNDSHQIVEQLKPLNPYGDSKNDFDIWALKQTKQPPFWAGLKFFNVYGPNEYHKARMASVILHTYRQILKTGKMRLFRSHRPDIENGQQQRDFIYIKDVLKILYFLAKSATKNTVPNGLYNVGTGKARSFLDLATATFHALGKTPDIEFIDTPADIRDTYQYFTQANMDKLHNAGYKNTFYDLESGIKDYVKNYIVSKRYL